MASRTIAPEELAQSRQMFAEQARDQLVQEQNGRVRREDLLSTTEIARLWNTSNQTIQRWRQHAIGGFPAPYLDDITACFWLKQDLYAWLKSLGQAIKTNRPVDKD